jgi:peptidoglycan/LPS O-acetylase OafA/YrhL
MTLNAIWPYFFLMAIVLGLAATPLLRFVDTPTASSRYSSIDGLRGFLALGVFVFHLIVTHRFIATGIWEPPSARFYALLGPLGVSLFFMITGFLFWGKLLRAKGRPRWRDLYIGRLFRIAPMYLLVVLVMLCVVFARTGFTLHEPPGTTLRSVLQWLALGLVDTQPDVNGYRATHVLAGVTWTIAYEWAFYASLLVTAYVARNSRHLPIVLTALLLCLLGKTLIRVDAIGFAALFLTGMAAASLLHNRFVLSITNRAMSLLALACLIAIFTVARSGYSTVTALLLAVFFYLVCSGASLFGLLTSVAAQRLGNISYSLYLMQGLILTLVLGITPIKDFAMATPHRYWVIGIACACALVVCASLGYAFIERPAIALGKHLAKGERAAPRPAESDSLIAP